MTNEELVARFNAYNQGEGWRKRKDWILIYAPGYAPKFPLPPNDLRPVMAIGSDGGPYDPRTRIQIDDARTIAEGWDLRAQVAAANEKIAKMKHTWQGLMEMVYGAKIPTEHCHLPFPKASPTEYIAGEVCLAPNRCTCTCAGCCYAKTLS